MVQNLWCMAYAIYETKSPSHNLCICRSVLAWRKWFHKQGQSGYWRQLGQEATPAPDLAREQLLDRYHQHTKNCPSCSKVLLCLLRMFDAHWQPCSACDCARWVLAACQ